LSFHWAWGVRELPELGQMVLQFPFHNNIPAQRGCYSKSKFRAPCKRGCLGWVRQVGPIQGGGSPVGRALATRGEAVPPGVAAWAFWGTLMSAPTRMAVCSWLRGFPSCASGALFVKWGDPFS
jgi:hypothetical protein